MIAQFIPEDLLHCYYFMSVDRRHNCLVTMDDFDCVSTMPLWNGQDYVDYLTDPGEGICYSNNIAKRLYRDWETDRKSTRLNSSH